MLTYLSKKDKFIYKLCSILIVSIFPFLLLNYDILPNQIPITLGFWGNITSSAEKTIFISLRLPIMAFLTLIICLLAHISNTNLLLNNKEILVDDKRKLINSISYIRMAFIISISIKISLVSISLFYIGNGFVTGLLQVLIIISAVAGAILGLCALYKIYKLKGINIKTLKIFEKKQIIILTILILAYLIVLIQPFLWN